MTPLTENPTVALLVKEGKVIASATNVAPDLNIVYTESETAFNDEAANKPFVTRTEESPAVAN